ncbi:MAG: GNAT family N-acetyltransferase [Fibrobacter sp.]|nr:GNAT family N-acetyltransferase [Fibrobacter sp.]
MVKIRRIVSHSACCDAFSLVKKVFNLFVASDYSSEGVETFFRLVTADYIESLNSRNGFVYGAFSDEHLVGIIAVRDRNYISLFFIDSDFQGIGIGGKLFEIARKEIAGNGEIAINVHSSPFAVPVYEALGFEKTDIELCEAGVRYTPMQLKLV